MIRSDVSPYVSMVDETLRSTILKAVVCCKLTQANEYLQSEEFPNDIANL